jgi:hypothetical protein
VDARAVAVRDGFAYVADGPLGLLVGMPAIGSSPARGSVPSSLRVDALALADGVVVVADSGFGLRISIADSRNVTEVGARE